MVSFRGLRFHDRAPVYQQIAESLKRQILLGAVQDGDPYCIIVSAARGQIEVEQPQPFNGLRSE